MPIRLINLMFLNELGILQIKVVNLQRKRVERTCWTIKEEITMATINNKVMTLEEALGLVEEVRNCSLPWDDAHWEALSIVIDYVKNNLNKEDK